MFETITKHVRENSVVRFLLSHLIILLAALLICAVGFLFCQGLPCPHDLFDF